MSNNGNAFLLNRLSSLSRLEYQFINNIRILNNAIDQTTIAIDLKIPINIYSILGGIFSDVFNVKKEEVIFFSSNSWDIHGASNFGLKTVWVNRQKKTDDYLPGMANYEVRSLEQFYINYLKEQNLQLEI